MESYNKKVIEKGKIKKQFSKEKNKDYKIISYYMQFLGIKDLEQILNVQSIVEQKLNNPELFQTDTKDFIVNMLDNKNGRIIGVFAEDSLIAYHTMLFPYQDTHNLGIDLNLKKSELDKVAHLESSAVLMDFRGNSLHSKMQSHLIHYAKKLGFKHLGVTIAPNNYPSIKASLNLRLYILRLKEKYGGKLRYIFYQNLDSPLKIDEYTQIEVKNTDIDKQKTLLNDEGFCGFSTKRVENTTYEEFILSYAKII
jgi:hypothetical protein